ncbi:hypothetical protein [uncultured Gammaproteobacteria bacterium]|nr:hypothetical protein [uncultured Gammaproteobacteria bacterium]
MKNACSFYMRPLHKQFLYPDKQVASSVHKVLQHNERFTCL